MPQQVILELASQALGTTLADLVSTIHWHENYMRWHDGDPTYHVLDDSETDPRTYIDGKGCFLFDYLRKSVARLSLQLRSLNKRNLLLVCIVVGALYVGMLVPNQRKIAWQAPVTFLVPPEEAYYKILVDKPDVTYLFYANHSMFSMGVFESAPLDQPFLINESIFYMKREGSTWGAPVLLNVSMINNTVKYLQFAIGYDLITEKFHVFAATWIPLERYCIWHTAGPLDALPPLEVVLNRTIADAYDYGRPTSLSPAFGPTGKIYLSYALVTSMTENINYVKVIHTIQGTWSGEEAVGIGNSPCTFVDAEGRAFVYSNLWTFTWGPQDCVDEWACSSTGSWVQAPVRTAAKDWNANPLVVEASDGTAYLFYDTRDSIVVQTASSIHGWSYYAVVVGGLENYSSPLAARLDANTITLYYTYKGEIKAVAGIQESGLTWYFPPLDQVLGVIVSLISFIPFPPLMTLCIIIIAIYAVRKAFLLRGGRHKTTSKNESIVKKDT